MSYRLSITLLLILPCIPLRAGSQTAPLSQQMAATVMDIWKDSLLMKPGVPVKWAYDEGVVLEGMEGVWQATGDGRYFRFIKKSMDFFVNEKGDIRKYKAADYSLDNIKNGRPLLTLYKVTGDKKYYLAAKQLREQLSSQPRVASGGFWHKKIYPHQMWLDGLYMAEPFYAEWAATFNEPQLFDDIARQFIIMEQVARDSKTGLLYHGWDESREQRWADKTTGQSPVLWARAMGWYIMGLVDVLDNFPADHPKRDTLLHILDRTAAALQSVQSKNGVWYQVLDKPDGKGNYEESSASCMFVYAIAKAVRNGYLDPKYDKTAKRGWAGILRQFISQRNDAEINLDKTVAATGLGGTPYRDGSYAYYLSEAVVSNDPKGVGAFLLAANEMEMAAHLSAGRNVKVLLDNYYNNEHKEDASGQSVSYHYTWKDRANSGFSTLGKIFTGNGAGIDMLPAAPNASNLRGAGIYIITDPDTKAETPSPNHMTGPDATAIEAWVKDGGVLVLLENDSNNSEFQHFNILAEKFGIHFNENSRNHVTGAQFEMGAMMLPTGNGIFKKPRKAYLKEISTLRLNGLAKSAFTDHEDVIIATAKVGKGRVFAIGDPWLYNEYVDGRKLPADFENYAAAQDLVQWLLSKAKIKAATK